MDYRVTAPGRICLFGEHQDYLGLPVIAAAISLTMTVDVSLEPEALGRYRILMPDLDRQEEIDLAAPLTYQHEQDYLRSCLAVLRAEGFTLPGALTATIRSTIPLAAGTSSSSALTVAWITALLLGAGHEEALDRARVARYAHRAEVIEFQEQGGMMDQLSIAHGGICHIDFTRDDPMIPLPCRPEGWVLGDSCQPKDTQSILGRVRGAAESAVKRITADLPGFDLRRADRGQAEAAAEQVLAGEEKQVFLGNLKNRDYLIEALDLLSSKSFSAANLGHLLLAHHEVLRDHLRISTPRIEAMLKAALEAGALGGKINGSGGGGCLFVLAPGCEAEVARAMTEAGGRAFPVVIHAGLETGQK